MEGTGILLTFFLDLHPTLDLHVATVLCPKQPRWCRSVNDLVFFFSLPCTIDKCRAYTLPTHSARTTLSPAFSLSFPSPYSASGCVATVLCPKELLALENGYHKGIRFPSYITFGHPLLATTLSEHCRPCSYCASMFASCSHDS